MNKDAQQLYVSFLEKYITHKKLCEEYRTAFEYMMIYKNKLLTEIKDNNLDIDDYPILKDLEMRVFNKHRII
jgi:hypothetical protein